jgi:hypothetical protein
MAFNDFFEKDARAAIIWLAQAIMFRFSTESLLKHLRADPLYESGTSKMKN